MSSVAEIVQLLRAASDAYYNGKQLTMDDDTFDGLVETLRQKDPKNSFLAEIGAPPREGAVTLPYPMPSLDKIKPGQDALGRFLGAGAAFVLSEKLDGLSALWIPANKKLYLRGDGIVGQDISHLAVAGIQGLVRPATGARVAVRGELVIPRSEIQTLARSWVNGVIHQKVPVVADVRRIRFVAYDLLEPVGGLTRSQAFAWMINQGFEIPVTKALTPTADSLAALLQEWRAGSRYDTDGVVVAYDAVPVRSAPGKNPKDMVAFKMPLADQSATTTIEEVQWKASAQGYLIPTLRFKPVEINGARIEFCTGHNARNVVDKGLGPGAIVRIRRSGDVIPTLDAVLAPAAGGAVMPPAGTWQWVSGALSSKRSDAANGDATADDQESNATHIVATTATDAQVAAQLQHFFKVVGIPSMGPANCEVLVKAGLTGPAAITAATAERLGAVLGPKTGAALYANLRTACATATEATLMMASSQMPRGVGEAKLKSLFEVCPDWEKWVGGLTAPPAGWTATSLEAFLRELPRYKAWRAKELDWIAPKAQQPVQALPPKAASASAKGVLCFTGFREKELETRATAAGFAVVPALTSKVTILVTPDPPKHAGTEKLAKARAAGTSILTRAEFVQKYLG